MQTKQEYIEQALSLGLGDLNYEPEIVMNDIIASGEQEWLKSRKSGIGGSEAGVLMGYSSYQTPLSVAFSKLSLNKTENDTDKQYIFDYGHAMEAPMLKHYARKLGYWVPLTDENNPSLSDIRDVREITEEEWNAHQGQGIVCVDRRQYRHPLHQCMLGDCDGLVITPQRERYGLECKTYNYAGKDSWKSGVYQRNSVDGGKVKNPEYVIQVAHYMSVLNLNRFDLLANCGNNPQDMTVVTFYRDLELEKEIINVEEKFWNELQSGQLPAEATLKKEIFDQIASLVKTERISAEPVHLQQNLQLFEELSTLNDQIAKNAEDGKMLKARKDALILPIVQQLAGNPIGIMDIDGNSHYEVTFKGQTRSSFDSEKMKLEMPEEYEKYKITSVTSPSFHYKTVREKK